MLVRPDNYDGQEEMTVRKTNITYDSITLNSLAYEFLPAQQSDTDSIIRQLLEQNSLGEFDAQRIARLRELKDSVQKEVSRWHHSKYFTSPESKKADQGDFDYERMTDDYCALYPAISREDMLGFVGFAIYLYYIR